MRALILVDLGFGDAGKGLLTDFLVRQTGAKVVVRYNGGAQAGHNVVTPCGRHHTFSQFGAGTFVPGVRTFLSRDVVVHPTALLYEEAALRAVDVTDALERLHVSENALVITPYHQALNRLRELARGAARHGSCGVGVGETVAHDRAAPDEAIRMRELADPARLRRKLRRIRDYAFGEVGGLDPRVLVEGAGRVEWEIFQRPEVAEGWLERTRSVAKLIADDDAWLPHAGEPTSVVFEGAQGVLLDEWHGFHPHTTWSDCTSAPARRLLAEWAPDAEPFTIGVLRSYAVRHGAGPLPTESVELHDVPAEHNASNDWQGPVRRGWFDAVLARYAVAADGGIDALAITHLDWLRSLRCWTYCDAYEPDGPLAPEPSAVRSLDHQERLTSRLTRARPLLRECPADDNEVMAVIEELVQRPVAMGSEGPSAADVFVHPANMPVSGEEEAMQIRGGAMWR